MYTQHNTICDRICKNMPNCRFNNYTLVAILSEYIILLILYSKIVDHLKQIVDHLKQIVDHQKQIVDHQKQIVDHQKQIVDHLNQNFDHLKQIVDHLKQIVDHLTFIQPAYVCTLSIYGRPTHDQNDGQWIFMEDRPMIKMMDNGYLWKTNPWSKWWTMDIYGRPTHDHNDGQWIFMEDRPMIKMMDNGYTVFPRNNAIDTIFSVLPQCGVYSRTTLIRGWRLIPLQVLTCNLVPST